MRGAQTDRPSAGIIDDRVLVVAATAEDPRSNRSMFPMTARSGRSSPPSTSTSIRRSRASLLQRVTPALHRAVSTAIYFSFTDSFSRSLAVSGDDAYVVGPTDTGFRIDRHELPR